MKKINKLHINVLCKCKMCKASDRDWWLIITHNPKIVCTFPVGYFVDYPCVGIKDQ